MSRATDPFSRCVGTTDQPTVRPHQSYAIHPTTVRAACSRSVHLYLNPTSSDCMGQLLPLPGTSIQTYGIISKITLSLDCLCLPHNYLHNAVQAQNAKLEQLEKTNKQLVAQNKQVLQLIQSMAKRRKLLASLTMIRPSQASKPSRGRSVPA